MIVLDTNVLSALMQQEPPKEVIEWLDRQPRTSVCTTAITIFEIEHGLRKLPDGKRKKRLQSCFVTLTSECLEHRVLPFDTDAAVEAGKAAATTDANGLTIGIRDLQIAGIVRAMNATLATRNVKDFAPTCPDVVNPWDDK